jgi:hypothetical protein
MMITLNIHKLIITGIFVVFISVFFPLQCVAQDSSGSGWTTLFNGEDLSGWYWVNGQHEAEVKDGIIKATEIRGVPNGFLCTTEEYDDFILELDVKTDILMENSGIQFRSLYRDDYRDGRLYGYQAQIQNRPPHVSQWNGAIYDEARRGWLYIIEDDPVRQKAYKQNQWNTFRVEAIGTTNRVWINGVPIVNLEDAESTHGFICLQIHGLLSGPAYELRYEQSAFMRNVRIQTENLRPSPYDDVPVLNTIANNLSGQEEFQGFSLLWDARTTQGWRGISQPEIPESGWEIDDGELAIHSVEREAIMSNGQGVMMTEKEYGPFELKFDFKQHTEGAIPGIKYFITKSEIESEKDREAIFGRLAAYETRGAGDWSHGVIKVLPDNRVEHWVNGYKILEYQRDAQKPAKGHIVLDAYESVSYRSIKIREF